MSDLSYYVKRLKFKIKKRLNLFLFKQVRTTSPASFEFDPNLVIVSQVYSDALDMALMAIKSFMIQIGRGRVEIIDDGSLTEDDKLLLNQQIPHLTIVNIKDIPLGKCPEGGTWERLVHILRLTKDAYVIQVDTDTLTIAPVPEVYQSINNNLAFTIGDPKFPTPIDVNYMSYIASQYWDGHIQGVSEEQLNKVTSLDISNYCRGCSAFTGFPKGVLDCSDLERFSVEMESKVGFDAWRKWGTEQFSSNVMVSLCPEVSILPWPKYLNFGFPFLNSKRSTYEEYRNLCSVIHFIGTNRFEGGVYRKLFFQVMKELQERQGSKH